MNGSLMEHINGGVEQNKTIIVLGEFNFRDSGVDTNGFTTRQLQMHELLMWQSEEAPTLIFIASMDMQTIVQILPQLTARFPRTFFLCVHPQAQSNAVIRQQILKAGGSMLSDGSHSAINQALKKVRRLKCVGVFTCPFCQMQRLTEDELWVHVPLFHSNLLQHPDVPSQSPKSTSEHVCPICHTHNRLLQQHIYQQHGPLGRGEIQRELRTGAFAIGIVKKPSTGQYLLVQEKCDRGFWLPGGGVDDAEGLVVALKREVMEEAGISAEVKGIVDKSIIVQNKGVWRRVTFFCEISPEDQDVKMLPDYESVGACWATIDEIKSGEIQFRSYSEIETLIEVDEGKLQVLPLELPEEYQQYFPNGL
eukprot:TRINITY_DN7210_c0_g1_i6.p1 TRINITY_DN7210_c0_g1~~TRINITY_DN7210_c0_g1_i6.p1  ORF type:complete len:364 (+),score=53.80 TRINITY_DN7210_c0_g1_i6:143-1234(+)